jgi:serine protease Do
MTKEAAAAMGLFSTVGVLVRSVRAGGPGEKAGMKAGDVILEFNGRPVKDNDDLVAKVVTTKPGTTVPVTVMREGKRQSLSVTIGELNLEAEQGRLTARPDQTTEPLTGLGMDIEGITPEDARQLELPSGQGGAVVSNVTRSGPAANAGVQPGDVILEVNRTPVRNVTQVTRELQRAQPGSTVFLLVWRQLQNGGGQQVFLTLRKR